MEVSSQVMSTGGSDVDPKPCMPYTKMLNELCESNYPKPQEKRITDRQGLLVGQARLLGTLDQLRTCPYNESHRVGEGRFHQHLFKCREANPEKAALIIICAFDASHHIPEEVYQKHLTVCWARNQQTALSEKSQPGTTSFHSYYSPSPLRKPQPQRVKCLVKLVGISGSEINEENELVTEARKVPRNLKFKTASFIGPAMEKPTTYTSWY